MKIRGKLIAGFILIAVFTPIIGYVNSIFTSRISQKFQEVQEETVPLIDYLEDLRYAGMRVVSSVCEISFLKSISQLPDKNTDIRGAISKENTLMKSGIELYSEAINRLIKISDAYIHEKERIAEIKKRGDALIQTGREMLISLNRGDNPFILLNLREELHRREKAFLDAIDYAISEEKKELVERTSDVKGALRSASGFYIVTSLGVFFIAALAGWIASGRISGPLKRLKDACDKVSKGDRSIRIDVSTKDEIGEISRAFNKMVLDLSRYEESIKSQSEFMKTVINSMEDSLAIIDARDFTILDTNTKFLERIGLRKKEVIGKNCHKLLHGSETPCNEKCPVKKVLNTGRQVTLEHVHTNDRGKERYTEIIATPIKDSTGRIEKVVHIERDITERRKMIDEIKTSEEYYRSFVEFSQDLIANISGDGTILTINPAGRIITGFSEEDITGRNILSFIVEGQDDFKKALSEALRGNTASVKYATRLPDGSTVWWDARLSPIRDIEGKIIRILLVARDVTQDMKYKEAILNSQEILVEERNELKKLVHEIERAKREWERTLDCVDDMIILTDNQGKIRRVNKTFKEFTGKSYKEILGQSWEDIIIEHGFETSTFYVGGIELYHPRTKRWFILNSYPYEDIELNFSGVVITIHENTEIKKITAELEDTNTRIEKNRKKLQNALNQISKLIESVRKQASYGVRFSNPHLRRCYEVKKCTKVDCPCYGKEAMRCWQIAGTYCGGEVQGAFAQKYKNCSECEVYKYATSDPIYEIGEQFNNMMHVLELKNKELENALNQLKATQAQMLQQEKMASIGQLAAGVAHEINNPMGFITSNLGTLSKYTKRLSEYIDLQTKTIEEIGSEDIKRSITEQKKKLKIDYILQDIEQLIEESLDGAERVKKIVQNLKSFSRVDEAEYKFADINECIESTLNIVWNELKYKAKVYKEYGELPLTKCYPQQLNQVFMNILVNAAQAIEKQGEIRIKTWNGDGDIYIAISDTGVGIPKDKINRIFEPFFTTKPVGKGTGLGLSITYDIVKKHNGDIQVESEVGKGTTFTIKIPIVEDNRNE